MIWKQSQKSQKAEGSKRRGDLHGETLRNFRPERDQRLVVFSIPCVHAIYDSFKVERRCMDLIVIVSAIKIINHIHNDGKESNSCCILGLRGFVVWNTYSIVSEIGFNYGWIIKLGS